MNSIVLNIIIYGIIAVFAVLMAYGLFGYAKQVFDANRH